jgi:hypothetical protein
VSSATSRQSWPDRHERARGAGQCAYPAREFRARDWRIGTRVISLVATSMPIHTNVD